MPKKTKKAKLIAELRRKLDTSPVHAASTVSSSEQHEARAGVSYSLPMKRSSIEANAPVVLTENEAVFFSLIRKDLVMTLGLIVFMLAIELGVWKMIG
jgi:hypothetical protein